MLRVPFIIALLTAVASEIKVVPFQGVDFRFGLGSIAFFLLFLIFSPQFPIRTGVMTGLFVVLFRAALEFDFTIGLSEHLPAFFYYVVFASGFHLLKLERYKAAPLQLGLFAAALESIGNSVEYVARLLLNDHVTLHVADWGLIFAVAILRSFFVVGLYSTIMITEQKKRMEELLRVSANLYGETLYLRKSMEHIEKIMASSFELSRLLKKRGWPSLSEQALRIAQEIHEVKKDSQRIVAGLLKVTEQRDDPLTIEQIVEFAVTANRNYSEFLQKKIAFFVDCAVEFVTDQHVPILTMFNNLIANAVEAIDVKGEIHLHVYEKDEVVYFVVKDSARALDEQDVDVIFEPGYTTKFNEKGVAATGIGLSHVREIARMFEGDVSVYVDERYTTFKVALPKENIRRKVE